MPPSDDADLAVVLGLYERAMQMLHEGAIDEALAAGEALIAVQFSGGFEVVALAHLARSEPDRALEALAEGTRVAPAVWLLWQLSGNTLSDLRRFDEADAAYDAALACPRVDAGAVQYNRALALRRAARFDAALAACDAAIDARPGFALPRVLRLGLLNDLARPDAVLASASELAARLGEEASVAERPNDPVGDPVRLRAEVLAEQASALMAVGGDRDAARAAALEAVAAGYFSPRAAAVIRALDGRVSAQARRHRVTVCGRWPELIDGRVAGFFRTFDVVAVGSDDALGFARPFVPQAARAGLTIERIEPGADAPAEPLGVYTATGFAFFDDDGT